MSPDHVILKNDYGRAVYSPRVGAALRSFRVQADHSVVELLTGGEGPHDPDLMIGQSGCFIMAPWPNRIRDGVFSYDGVDFMVPVNSPPHAIHGTVRDRKFDVVDATATRAVFETSLGDDWPFAGNIRFVAALDGAALVQTIEIHADNETFPAGFGWHPWFRRNLGAGDMSIIAPVEEVWVFDREMTPSGETVAPEGPTALQDGIILRVDSVNGCFRIRPGGETVLDWPEITLSITSSPELGHLQVYTPKGSVCVEPQTSCVNAFALHDRGIPNTGFATASPAAPFAATTRWAWST